MDDSSVDAAAHGNAKKLHRHASETNLAADFLTIPQDREKTGSKFSLIDKFADVSKAISDKQTQRLAAKSPFSLFKKSKSREPSPAPDRKNKKGKDPYGRNLPAKIQISSSEYSEESETESLGVGLDHRKQPVIKKTMSDASYGSENLESEAEIQEMEAAMDYIDEYYYGVRIFPGQDPTNIFIGWVSPGFHASGESFDMKTIRNVVVCTLDFDYKVVSRSVQLLISILFFYPSSSPSRVCMYMYI